MTAECRSEESPESAGPQSCSASHAVGHAVVGVVVQAATGRPIPGARVYWADGFAVADPAGRFELGGLRAKDLQLWITARGFVPRRFAIGSSGSRQAESFDIPLDSAPIVRGFVVDQGGRPITEAKVEARVEWWVDACVTGPDGAFEVTAAESWSDPDDRIDWQDRITAAKDGYTPADASHVVARPVIVRLEPADVRVEGHVRDEAGQPVAGAEVRCASPPQLAVSDGHGFFRLDRCHREDSLVLVAKAPGTRSATAYVRTRGGQPVTGVVLTVPVQDTWTPRVEGRVTDDTGRGVPGARVALYHIGMSGESVTSTGSDGRFAVVASWPEEPSLGLYLSAEAPGHARGVSTIEELQPSGPVLLTLTRTGHASGRVVDAATGLPIRDAEVALVPDRLPGWRSSATATTRTSESGAFELEATAGWWKVCASHGGYRLPEAVLVHVPARERSDVGSISLTRGGVIEGRITGGSARNGGEFVVFVAPPGRRDFRFAGLLDDSGWFRNDHLPAGTWEVFVATRAREEGCHTHHVASLQPIGTVETVPGGAARIEARLPEASKLTVVAKARGDVREGSVARGAPVMTTGIDPRSEIRPRGRDGEANFEILLRSLDQIPMAWTDDDPLCTTALVGWWTGNGLDARLTLPNLAAGAYSVTLTGTGFPSVETTVTVGPGDWREVALTLPAPR